MTTEDDFQKALDAHPDDWQTRLVFADWLEEHNDPRAEGYRALAILRVQPIASSNAQYFAFTREDNPQQVKHRSYTQHVLPKDWYDLLPPNELGNWDGEYWKYMLGRNRTEDGAALAFARLPAERRAALLAAGGPS